MDKFNGTANRKLCSKKDTINEIKIEDTTWKRFSAMCVVDGRLASRRQKGPSPIQEDTEPQSKMVKGHEKVFHRQRNDNFE